MSTGLQLLEAFFIEAKSLRSVEELCELGAVTAVRLTGAEHAMTWLADRRASSAAHHVGCAGLEAGPAKAPSEWPALIERALTTEATGRQTHVQRGDLGLPNGAPHFVVKEVPQWCSPLRCKGGSPIVRPTSW